MVSFDDFNIYALKVIIRDYNLHLIIKNFSKLSKEQLIKKLEEHLYIDKNNNFKFKPKTIKKFTDWLNSLQGIMPEGKTKLRLSLKRK